MTNLRHLGAEERIHERRLARAAATHERERGSALFEEDGPEEGDLGAEVFHRVGVERKELKHLFDTTDVLGDDLPHLRLVLGLVFGHVVTA